MSGTEDYLLKKSSQCATDYQLIETKYENIEYIDDEFVVGYNEVACEEVEDSKEVKDDNIGNCDTYAVDHDQMEVCVEVMVEDNIIKFDHDDMSCEGAMVYENLNLYEETADETIYKLEVEPCPEYMVCFSPESELTKKRKRHPELWKSNIRKRQRESGQQYISMTNKKVPARILKPPCNGCCYNCANLFTAEERLNIFKSFWSLTDNEKINFYFKFVVRDTVKRRRTVSAEKLKQFTFKYYFEKNHSIHRVCRVFFLNTLSIDQKRIYYCFQNFKNQYDSRTKDNIAKYEEAYESDQGQGEDEISEKATVCEEDPEYFPSASGFLLTEKRRKNPELKKSNIRSRQRKSEQQYISINKKDVYSRTLKPPCNDCCFDCVNIFTAKERLNIFKRFWSLSGKEKIRFLFKFVVRNQVERSRTYSAEKLQQFTFKYYFEKNQSIHRVCQVFFLNTLSINQKRIDNYFHIFKNKYDNRTEDNKGKFDENNDFGICQDEVEVSEEVMVSEEVGACEETVEDTVCKLEDNPVNFSSENVALLTKKGKTNPNLSKSIIKSRQQSKEIKNENVRAVTLRPPCNECCYNCANIFTAKERLNIFELFWSLTDKEKINFYFKFVVRDKVDRHRKYSAEKLQQFTFKYYFEKNQSMHRVCRVFFLNTLGIDQNKIYYCFQNFKNKYDSRTEDNKGKFDENDDFAMSQDEVVASEVMEEVCEETAKGSIGELEEVVVPDNPDCFSSEIARFLTKKGKKNSKLSSSNVRNMLRKYGKQYISIKNEKVPAKTMKPPCSECRLNCAKLFTPTERLNIFKSFWSLTDEEKISFYFKFVIQDQVKHRRKCPEEKFKKFTFKYFFEKNKSMHRVCRVFFLNTLSIDQKRIYYNFQIFKNKSVSRTEDNMGTLDEIDKFAICQDEVVVNEEAKHEEIVLPDDSVCFSSENVPSLTEKGKKNPELKKSSIRRIQIKSRQQYKELKKEKIAARTLKPPCNECCYNCSNLFTAKERLKIFKSFWSLTDKERIRFYFKYVVRGQCKRRRVHSEEKLKKFTFKYYFEKNQTIHRVCRVFFINTLGIDQNKIYYCFQNFKNKSASSTKDNIGKFEEVVVSEDAGDSICKEEEYIVPCPEYPVGLHSEAVKKNPKLLKSSIRKGQQNPREQYKAIINKKETPKTMKASCDNCFLNCSNRFTANERLNIFKSFWSLSNEEKRNFYLKYVLRDQVKHRRKNLKQFTFNYYFEKNQSIHRVCREFFLNTLSIDQKRIYYFFQKIKNKSDSSKELYNIGKMEEDDEFAKDHDDLMVSEEAIVCEEKVEDGNCKLEKVVVPCSVYPVCLTSEAESLLTKQQRKYHKRSLVVRLKRIKINNALQPEKS